MRDDPARALAVPPVRLSQTRGGTGSGSASASSASSRSISASAGAAAAAAALFRAAAALAASATARGDRAGGLAGVSGRALHRSRRRTRRPGARRRRSYRRHRATAPRRRRRRRPRAPPAARRRRPPAAVDGAAARFSTRQPSCLAFCFSRARWPTCRAFAPRDTSTTCCVSAVLSRLLRCCDVARLRHLAASRGSWLPCSQVDLRARGSPFQHLGSLGARRSCPVTSRV